MQQAWVEFGREAFSFSVLEDCGRNELQEREQEYINVFQPSFNGDPIASARSERVYQLLAARGRARSAIVTHCPQRHEYTESNTGYNLGKRYCRACAAEWSRAKLVAETPEQREARIQRTSAYYEANKAAINAQMREYAAGRKDEKHAYDVSRREINRQLSAERRATETPEQRARRLEQKAADYEKHKEKRLAAQHEAYRRAHPEPEPATACKSGHPYVEGSFRVWRGLKECKICRAISKKAYRERAKLAETPEAHVARLAKRNERERDTWHDVNQRAYQRRKERQVA